MHPKLVQQLNDVLDLVGYTADRDHYAKQYFNICAQQAVALLADTLPESDRLEFDTKLAASLEQQQHDHAAALIKHHFSRIEFDRAMEEIMYDDMLELGEAVMPTLQEDRREQLQQYLGRLSASRAHMAAV